MRGFRSLGVDIGKRRDPPAAVILEQDGRNWDLILAQRIDLGTSYPTLTRNIRDLSLGADITAVDANGVGDVVIDYLLEDYPGMRLWRVLTHSGNVTNVDYNRRIYSTPKKSLVGLVAKMFFEGRINYGDGSGDLIDELKQMSAYQADNGYIHLRAAKGHDDLVFALCLAMVGGLLSRAMV